MSSPEIETKIREALTSAKYRDPDRTAHDVLEVLPQYPGLKAVTENYVYNDGSEQLLIGLNGTIPIHHKGNVYNIPIAIWLLNTYPFNAPMVFVKPTPEMRIKVSEYVMSDGKVHLPYLQEWKHGSSELLLLIQVLIITFQDDPPVYAIQSSPPQLQALSPSSAVPSASTNYPIQLNSPGISEERLRLLTTASEKLIKRMCASFKSTCLEQSNSSRLKAGSERLTMMLKRITDEKEILERNLTACQEEIVQLDARISHDEAIVEYIEANIQDSIHPPKPLYKQIVTAYGEDAALEDAIYFVGEGFRSGRMDLDQFEKSIRKLARRQFMARLLIRKCRDKAGLP